MGLLPLEFSDCLLDSPYFRENLKAHEKQLDQTSISIKALIGGIQEVLDSAKLLIKSKKSLADTLDNCQFDCLGTTLTDDEILIASSLKQFAKFLSAMEDEMNGILLQANEKFITPLLNFRKDQIGSVKQTKKAFDKATSKLCTAQDRYVNMSGKKEESLAEAAENIRHELKNLNSSSLEYVYLMHVVQERKKFEFVEAILNFTQSWVNYYKRGNAVACDQAEYMTDLKSRVQKTRDNFSATIEQYESLKKKMVSSPQDPGLLNKMYTRQGYLFVQGKKKLGSGWTKYYCQYQTKTKTLTMIPYNQLTGKITSAESLRVTGCICRDDISEKFRFSVTGEDLTEAGTGMVTHTMQALSEYERKNWVEALGGTWPAVNTLQRIRADSVEENLNSCAFTFLKDCLSELEARGLTDQGLYRVGGVVSKVKKLLNQALDPQPGEDSPDMSDPKQWESKTLASAVKQYFRDLSKPLMTYHLYNNFIEAVKHENESSRLNEIYLVLQKLPRANREILKVLIRHLNKVSIKHDKNLMTASNLGVCFGPTLLRPREETVASIMDIKFCNEVIEILIEKCERFFPSAESSPEFLHNRRPSIESRSTGATSTCSQADLSSPPKCKRTQSFSSFSQLSTNSLPDIKEFHNERNDRPRSKSHQHEFPPPVPPKEGSPAPLHLSKAATQDDLMASLEMMNLLAADLPSNSPLKRSYTLNPKRMRRTPAREVTRKPPLPKLTTVPLSPSTPTSVSSSQNIPGLYSNPPTSAPLSHTYQTTSSTNGRPPPFTRQNSAPTSNPVSSDNELYFKNNQSFTRPNRPTDLPGKLFSAFEGLCASPSQNRRASEESLVIEEYGGGGSEPPPPIPTRKTKKVFVSQATHLPYKQRELECKYSNCINLEVPADNDNISLSSQDPSNYSHSPREGSEDRLSSQDFLYTVTTSSPVPTPRNNYSDHESCYNMKNNISLDSGVITSPSPPTDSGIALSPPSRPRHPHYTNKNDTQHQALNNLEHPEGTHSEDAISVLSCSLSEASDTSGSKYDNVEHLMKNNQVPEEVERRSVQKDEDALSDSSNILENLAEDSSESDTGHYDSNERDINNRHNAHVNDQRKDLPRDRKCLDNMRGPRENRDSGPYENVATDPEQTGKEILENDKHSRIADSVTTYEVPDNSEETLYNKTGLHSLRRILTSGQTTNV